MLRCPACRTNDRTLLRFGVYLCPACGVTDADGVALSAATAPEAATGHAPAPAAARGSAFTPPPITHAAQAASTLPPDRHASSPPRILVLTVGGMVLLDVIAFALGDRSACMLSFLVRHVVLMVAVLLGSTWARGIGLLSGVIGLAFAALLFVLAAHVPDARLATVLRVLGGLEAGLDVFWMYVLLRDDVTAYFVHNARK